MMSVFLTTYQGAILGPIARLLGIYYRDYIPYCL